MFIVSNKYYKGSSCVGLNHHIYDKEDKQLEHTISICKPYKRKT